MCCVCVRLILTQAFLHVQKFMTTRYNQVNIKSACVAPQPVSDVCDVKLPLTSSNWPCATAARAELYTLDFPSYCKRTDWLASVRASCKKQLQICAKEDFREKNRESGYWHTASVQPTFRHGHCFLFGQKNPTFMPLTRNSNVNFLCVYEHQII